MTGDPMLCQNCHTWKIPQAFRKGWQDCWKCTKKEYNLVKFCGQWVRQDDLNLLFSQQADDQNG